MFSFFAKTLVLLFTVISVFCLMGAVAVKTQKMDYVTPVAGEAGKKTFNRVEQARNKAKELLVANQRAITRLSLEMEPLVEIESDQLQRRDYYYAQIQMMRTGKWYNVKDPVAEPIQEIQYDKDTDLIRIHTNKEEPPKLPAIKVFADKMDVPAQPASGYLTKIRAINTDIDLKIAAIKKLIEEHALATLIINGSEQPGMVRKGLRTRIKEQIVIKEDAIAETEFLEDYVSRRQAEAELFVKRRDAMADRLTELKKFFKIMDEPAVPGN